MPERIADMLMRHVYSTVSAAVSVGERNEVLSLKLFDTVFGAEYMQIHPAACEVWLFSNHPEGCTSLYEADLHNIRRIRSTLGTAKLRVFVVNEDFGCIEIAQ